MLITHKAKVTGSPIGCPSLFNALTLPMQYIFSGKDSIYYLGIAVYLFGNRLNLGLYTGWQTFTLSGEQTSPLQENVQRRGEVRSPLPTKH